MQPDPTSAQADMNRLTLLPPESTSTRYTFVVPSELDEELATIVLLVQVIERVNPDTAGRALRYINDRYEALNDGH